MEKANAEREAREITFLIEAKQAKTVYLVYEVNGWNIHWHPMTKDTNGTWSLRLPLPEGEYEYKFYVDDQWKIDPRNTQERMNHSGGRNSVLIVA